MMSAARSAPRSERPDPRDGPWQRLLSELLRDGDLQLPSPISWDDPLLLETAVRHHVHAMLADRLDVFGQRGQLDPRLERLQAALRGLVRRQALVEALQAGQTRRVLDRLAACGVRPVLIKGVPLAYTVYAKPYHRPRGDVDLVIRKEDTAVVREAMERLGYRRSGRIDGEQITHQFQYWTDRPADVRHEFDFHWRLAEPVLFADLLSYDDLDRRAVPIPALGDHARGASDVDALFIACIHRVAHHNDADDLIWLYDIRLLAARLSADGWSAFADLAARTRSGAVCAASLTAAVAAGEVFVPPAVREALASARAEPTASFLGGRLRRIDIELSNFRALSGWRPRARLLWQHLFPSASYMRQTYGVSRRIGMPAAYAMRMARGAARWFRPLGRI